MKSGSKFRIILNIIAFVFFLAAAVYMFKIMTSAPPKATFGGRPTSSSIPLVNIETVSLQPFSLKIEVTGTVESVNSGNISADVSGKLVEISSAFIVGGIVKAGQPLGRIEDDEYRSAIIQAESQLNSAKSVLLQEQAQAKVAQSELKRTGRSVSGNPLAARLPQIASAQAAVKAANASLQLAKDKISKTVIRAPFAGEISETSVVIGQQVGAGSSLGKLFSNSGKRVKVSLSEDELSAFKTISAEKDQPLLAKISLLGGSNSGVINGRMQSLSSSINSNSQLYQGYVITDNANDAIAMKVGEIVSVELYPAIQKKVLSLPVGALGQDNKVRVLAGDDKRAIESKTVEPTWWGDERVIISSGLQIGDTVIVTPLSSNTLDGSKVRVVGDPVPKKPVFGSGKGNDSIENATKTVTKKLNGKGEKPGIE